MCSDEKSMTRRELYDLVWSIPITKLSKKYGLSDVGFAKICKKYNIPRPPRGYWARIASGQTLKKTPLPPGKKEQLTELSPNPNPELKRIDTPKALESKLFRESIFVSDTLRGAHPLVKQATEILKTTEPDHLGMLKPGDNECLDITVSKKSLRRAMLIMDGFIKAFEGKGYEVFLVTDSTQVRIDDVTLKINMTEEVKTIQKERKKHDLEGYYHFGHSDFDTERVPSGNLCLTIDEHFWRWNEHYRKNWRDTPTKRLEDQLHGFANGLLKAADQKRVRIRKEEERQRKEREMELERQERARVRAEKIEQKKLEQKKVSKLLADSEDWRKSRLLRKYIAEVQRRAENGAMIGIPDSDLTEWLNWANQQADRLDPFSESPQSILDEEIEEDEKPKYPYTRW